MEKKSRSELERENEGLRGEVRSLRSYKRLLESHLVLVGGIRDLKYQIARLESRLGISVMVEEGGGSGDGLEDANASLRDLIRSLQVSVGRLEGRLSCGCRTGKGKEGL